MLRSAFLLTFLLMTGCVTTQLVPAEWQSVPQAARIEHVRLDDVGNVTYAMLPARDQGVRVENNRLVRGEKTLTDAFAAIDSFDLSESRGEVAFSAKRKDNFDIGLVAIEGSPVSWVPEESVDEVGVQWAPRGNKISYTVRSTRGDFVRVVHIPTGVPISLEFPEAKIRTLGWSPNAEKFGVVYSTPDASDRVEVMHYRGSQRKIARPPAAQLEVSVEPFGADGVSLRPREIEYGEKLPLVVWLDDEPFGWNDARGELIRNARVVVVVARRPLDDEAWRVLRETAWVDTSRVFIVGGAAGSQPAQSLHITADAALPPNTYLRRGTVVAVAPAVVQSFAARFIAGELKRTNPANGSSR